MILIKRNIFENNMTLDIDKVTECVLLITRIEILFQIWYVYVWYKTKVEYHKSCYQVNKY